MLNPLWTISANHLWLYVNACFLSLPLRSISPPLTLDSETVYLFDACGWLYASTAAFSHALPALMQCGPPLPSPPETADGGGGAADGDDALRFLGAGRTCAG